MWTFGLRRILLRPKLRLSLMKTCPISRFLKDQGAHVRPSRAKLQGAANLILIMYFDIMLVAERRV